MRFDKGLDPALGLYAAYAYVDADLRDEVASVQSYMREDLGGDLFDVAMLSRNQRLSQDLVAPSCPMLTQGWNLLRSRRIDLPPLLSNAQDELLPALWTTFPPQRMSLILNALRAGTLGP